MTELNPRHRAVVAVWLQGNWLDTYENLETLYGIRTNLGIAELDRCFKGDKLDLGSIDSKPCAYEISPEQAEAIFNGLLKTPIPGALGPAKFEVLRAMSKILDGESNG